LWDGANATANEKSKRLVANELGLGDLLQPDLCNEQNDRITSDPATEACGSPQATTSPTADAYASIAAMPNDAASNV
jgi:hypothetical protein